MHMARLPDRSAARRPLLRPFRGPAGRPRLWVYAIHPGGLPADVWEGLATALPADVGLSVFDLQNVPEYFEAALTGGMPSTTLPDLAGRCRAALAEQRAATGTQLPYALVGWSFGGVVAFEVARGLAGGDRPEHLVLLDSIAPTPEFKRTEDLLEPPLLIRWFAMYLAAKRRRPLSAEPQVPVPPVAIAGRGGVSAAEATEAGLAALLRTVTGNGVLPADTPLAGLRKLYDSYVGGLLRNNHLVLPYQPQPLGWPLTMVKASRSLLPEYGDMGWSDLAPLRLEHVEGDHYSILSDPSAWAAVADLVSGPPASAAA
jgi:thioesterase domain-containing protein